MRSSYSYWMIVVIAIIMSITSTQSGAQSNEADLNMFMDKLLIGAPSGMKPSAETSARVFDQIPSMPADSLRKATGNLQKALEDKDPDVRRLGIIAVYCIDQRPDSASIVASLASPLVSLLDDSDSQLVALAIRSLYSMKPKPPDFVGPSLTAYLGEAKALNVSGATTVFALSKLMPSDPEAGKAIVTFLKSPTLPNDIRVDSLNALGNPLIKNRQVISQVAIDAQSSRSEEVRLAAINALGNMGPTAVGMASQQLEDIVLDPNGSEAVRSAAKELLRTSNKTSN